jgi:hypothetical protein
VLRQIRYLRLRLVLAVITTIALGPSSAHAQYLDPGAGSVIVQAVIAVVVGVAATVKLYWRQISAFLARRSKERRQP